MRQQLGYALSNIEAMYTNEGFLDKEVRHKLHELSCLGDSHTELE
jgi:hypothetical protein